VLLAIAGIVGGLILLTYAADQFVVGAARVAISLRLSKVVVGAVVIGFGTSAPELMVSAIAGTQGSLDLALGNIVGSNIANLTLILGVAALATPIVIHVSVLKREAVLSLLLVVLFAAVLRSGAGIGGAVILAAALLAALTYVVIAARRDDGVMAAEVDEFLADESGSGTREWIRTILGLLGTLAGAQLLVMSATEVAALMGLAEGFIGLTVVAVGTSLPELATSLQAARKDETDLIVGNLLGSNMFNSGAVAAVALASGAGGVASPTIVGIGTILMVAVALVATLMMITGQKVVRWEGALLLAAYVAFLPLMVR
jgi:cation:H+ antiporter